MTNMTDEQWQHLYESFETVELLAAVDAIDKLRDDLNDHDHGAPPATASGTTAECDKRCCTIDTARRIKVCGFSQTVLEAIFSNGYPDNEIREGVVHGPA